MLCYPDGGGGGGGGRRVPTLAKGCRYLGLGTPHPDLSVGGGLPTLDRGISTLGNPHPDLAGGGGYLPLAGGGG